MPSKSDDRGVVLLAAVLMLLILAGLGMATMNIAGQEIQGFHAVRESVVARHLAEAGIELVREWFHAPDTRSMPPAHATLFAPQYRSLEGGASFFDDQGRSQFKGSPEQPDLQYDTTSPAEDRLVNDPQTGWFRSLRGLGRIVRVTLYGPRHPGLLCTVEVTAETGRLRQTVSAQLEVRMIPPLRAAVQSGPVGRRTDPPEHLPTLVHWGTVKWAGDGQLDLTRGLPYQSAVAPITGQSYAQMATPEDRWLEWLVGGTLSLSGPAGTRLPPLAQVHDRQEPVPGLALDRWDYETMKRHALRDGTYYTRGSDGRLYRPGDRPGDGLAPEDVFRSREVGDHRGLVFVDTLDGQAPRHDNLGTLLLEAEYMEGLFMVNADVQLKPKGGGRAVPALSPPVKDRNAPAGRVGVPLSNVHLNGVLYTPGSLQMDGPTRVFGALVAEMELVGGPPAATGSDLLEVWYNYDLQEGLPRGIPRVSVVPGTWQEW